MKSFADILADMDFDKVEASEDISSADKDKWRIDALNGEEGNLHDKDGYNCSLCKNRGYFSKLDEEGNMSQYDCECKKTRRALELIRSSGLSELVEKSSFQSFITSEPWQKVFKSKAEGFCKDKNARLFFAGGQVGCGKTHLCTAICNYFMTEARRETLYMVWCEDAKRLKARINDADYQEQLAKYKSVDILYIDDFLKVKQGETPTAADINLAFEIINYRYNNKNKITIVSCEKTLDEIIDCDQGTGSRIAEMAADYKVNVERDESRNFRLKQ